MHLKFVPISEFDENFVATFDCNDGELTHWFRNFAIQNEKRGISRTFLIKNNRDVVGFYTLSTGGIFAKDLGKTDSEYPKYQLPTVVIARLVVVGELRSKGIGT